METYYYYGTIKIVIMENACWTKEIYALKPFVIVRARAYSALYEWSNCEFINAVAVTSWGKSTSIDCNEHTALSIAMCQRCSQLFIDRLPSIFSSLRSFCSHWEHDELNIMICPSNDTTKAPSHCVRPQPPTIFPSLARSPPVIFVEHKKDSSLLI